MVKKVKKPVEKTVQLQKIELPFLKWYLYFFRVGDEIVFVDPTLVVGSIFTDKYELVFPCSGKLVSVGYKEYALTATSPAVTEYRLHLLQDGEDVPVSRVPYGTQTFRVGDKLFAYFVPLNEDEYEEEDEWDDGIDDYYDDDD